MHRALSAGHLLLPSEALDRPVSFFFLKKIKIKIKIKKSTEATNIEIITNTISERCRFFVEKKWFSPTEGKQWSEQHEPVLVVYYPSGYHLMTGCPTGYSLLWFTVPLAICSCGLLSR